MTIKNYVKAIEERCDKDEETGCWNWTRAKHVQGYGMMRHGGNMKTPQRIMAIEMNLFDDINFYTRIGNSCNNKLCCNPDHIVSMTHTEVNYKRYDRLGTGGKFEGIEEQVRNEYNDMKSNKIPRIINILAKKYDCHPTMIYRAIDKANGK